MMGVQMVLVLSGAGAAFFAVYALPRFAALRARQLEIQKLLMTDFFDAAEKLAGMDEVPDWMMEQLDAVAVFLLNGGIARRFVSDVVTGRFHRFVQDRDIEIREQQTKIISLGPVARGLYLQALVCGMLTMTYSAPFFGAVVRRTVFASLKRSDRSQTYQNEVPDRQTLGAIGDLMKGGRVPA